MITEKKIAVLGLGYIGLPTAALLASKGFEISGTDINQDIVNTINEGRIHIVENDLESLVKDSVEAGKLRAFTEVQPSDIYIICVPTPFDSEGEFPRPDTTYVFEAINSVLPIIKDGDTLIIESTCPVGTTEEAVRLLSDFGLDTEKINIAYCPERVLPGNIISELVENDRVIGGYNQRSTEAVLAFYEHFVTGDLLPTDAKTAEMCKLTENSFRDVNIAFANELSMICSEEGINVWELIKLANHHPRVQILQPGTGVGGHCIAVDPWFIVDSDFKNSKLIRQARLVNDHKPQWVIQQIEKKVLSFKEKKKIACLGLSFKPNIDDLRQSPAITVVDALIEKGFNIKCVEPNIVQHSLYDIISLEQAISESDLFIILVNHDEFKTTNFKMQVSKLDVIDFSGALEQ